MMEYAWTVRDNLSQDESLFWLRFRKAFWLNAREMEDEPDQLETFAGMIQACGTLEEFGVLNDEVDTAFMDKRIDEKEYGRMVRALETRFALFDPGEVEANHSAGLDEMQLEEEGNEEIFGPLEE
jgi:hypothetical protein